MGIAEKIVNRDLCPLCTCPGDVCDCSPEAVKAAGGHIFVAQRANFRRDVALKDLKKLEAMKAEVLRKNDGHHWIITVAGKRYDYWPSRQKFRGPESPHILRGFERMVGLMRAGMP